MLGKDQNKTVSVKDWSFGCCTIPGIFYWTSLVI